LESWICHICHRARQIKERLSVDDERVKVIDELIAKVISRDPSASGPQA